MDPQQRLLLETSHAALRRPHLDGLESMIGSLTGVFAGMAAIEFDSILKTSPLAGSVYAATGANHAIASGRISFTLGHLYLS